MSQNIKVELESVQEDLNSTRKDKFMLQAKVGELRNSMKTVLLQNQQLKQDLKQSRIRKVRNIIFLCENLFYPVKVWVFFQTLCSHSSFYFFYLFIYLFWIGRLNGIYILYIIYTSISNELVSAYKLGLLIRV